MSSLLKSWLAILILGLAIYYLSYYAEQNNFTSICIGYSLSFLGYGLLIFDQKTYSKNGKQLLIAVILPVIALFNFPNLSDDIYRFIWDGYLINAGVNPYSDLPQNIIGQYPGLDVSLFDQLNSKSYFSIYPTVSQSLFWFVTHWTNNIYIQVLLLKIIYLMIHLGGLRCIYLYFKKNQRSLNMLLLYYANPLVIVEGIGNLHAEINMVSFLFIALYFWEYKRDWLASICFSFAISVKLIPILFLGYFLFRTSKIRLRSFLIKTVTITTILSLPIIYGMINGGFLDSIDLYLRKFEFNASLYYILRFFGQLISGFNLIAYIGPLLLISFIIIALSHLNKTKFQSSMEAFIVSNIYLLTLYFLFATIVHPWYIIGLLGLNIFLAKKYILIWSFLITLTYINYSYYPYFENLWIVCLEYLIVVPLFVQEMGLRKWTHANFLN